MADAPEEGTMQAVILGLLDHKVIQVRIPTHPPTHAHTCTHIHAHVPRLTPWPLPPHNTMAHGTKPPGPWEAGGRRTPRISTHQSKWEYKYMYECKYECMYEYRYKHKLQK